MLLDFVNELAKTIQEHKVEKGSYLLEGGFATSMKDSGSPYVRFDGKIFYLAPSGSKLNARGKKHIEVLRFVKGILEDKLDKNNYGHKWVWFPVLSDFAIDVNKNILAERKRLVEVCGEPS